MTIPKPSLGEKKENAENEAFENPEVVIGGSLPPKKELPDLPLIPPTRAVRRHSRFINLCVLITALIVLTIGVVGGIYLYKHLAHKKYIGRCGVNFYEERGGEAKLQRGHHRSHSQNKKHKHFSKYYGHFQEVAEIGDRYEKIDVPRFDECSPATVVHDFDKNLTAIVDIADQRCYVMTLNRTLVRPPRDYWDLINKLKTGYYMPNARVVREFYRVVHPSISDPYSLGVNIGSECLYYESYRLLRITQNSIFKRSASLTKTYAAFAGGEMIMKRHKKSHNNVLEPIVSKYTITDEQQ